MKNNKPKPNDVICLTLFDVNKTIKSNDKC